jgi:hypothetical protein
MTAADWQAKYPLLNMEHRGEPTLYDFGLAEREVQGISRETWDALSPQGQEAAFARRDAAYEGHVPERAAEAETQASAELYAGREIEGPEAEIG